MIHTSDREPQTETATGSGRQHNATPENSCAGLQTQGNAGQTGQPDSEYETGGIGPKRIIPRLRRCGSGRLRLIIGARVFFQPGKLEKAVLDRSFA